MSQFLCSSKNDDRKDEEQEESEEEVQLLGWQAVAVVRMPSHKVADLAVAEILQDLKIREDSNNPMWDLSLWTLSFQVATRNFLGETRVRRVERSPVVVLEKIVSTKTASTTTMSSAVSKDTTKEGAAANQLLSNDSGSSPPSSIAGCGGGHRRTCEAEGANGGGAGGATLSQTSGPPPAVSSPFRSFSLARLGLCWRVAQPGKGWSAKEVVELQLKALQVRCVMKINKHINKYK